MTLYRAIRSELVKLRHTPLLPIHIFVPTVGAILFTSYFGLYSFRPDYNKYKLIFEITATFFPILISIITGLNTFMEDHTAHSQPILSVPNRITIFCGKFLVLFGGGVLSLISLVLLFSILVAIQGLIPHPPYVMLLETIIVLAFGNIILYIFHLFIGFKFGLGPSLFLGVFESLQVIMYSNIVLAGVWKYIPFAWAIDLSRYVLDDKLSLHKNEVFIMGLITIIAFIAVTFWISQWEGRKNDD